MKVFFGYKLNFFVGENIDDLKFKSFLGRSLGGSEKYGYSHVKNQLMKKEPEAELFPKSLVPFVNLINNWSSKFEDASG